MKFHMKIQSFRTRFRIASGTAAQNVQKITIASGQGLGFQTGPHVQVLAKEAAVIETTLLSFNLLRV